MIDTNQVMRTLKSPKHLIYEWHTINENCSNLEPVCEIYKTEWEINEYDQHHYHNETLTTSNRCQSVNEPI